MIYHFRFPKVTSHSSACVTSHYPSQGSGPQFFAALRSANQSALRTLSQAVTDPSAHLIYNFITCNEFSIFAAFRSFPQVTNHSSACDTSNYPSQGSGSISFGNTGSKPITYRNPSQRRLLIRFLIFVTRHPPIRLARKCTV